MIRMAISIFILDVTPMPMPHANCWCITCYAEYEQDSIIDSYEMNIAAGTMIIVALNMKM